MLFSLQKFHCNMKYIFFMALSYFDEPTKNVYIVKKSCIALKFDEKFTNNESTVQSDTMILKKNILNNPC